MHADIIGRSSPRCSAQAGSTRLGAACAPHRLPSHEWDCACAPHRLPSQEWDCACAPHRLPTQEWDCACAPHNLPSQEWDCACAPHLESPQELENKVLRTSSRTMETQWLPCLRKGPWHLAFPSGALRVVQDLTKCVGEAVLDPAPLEIKTRKIVDQFLDTTTIK